MIARVVGISSNRVVDPYLGDVLPWSYEDGVAPSVEHWTSNLAARVRSSVGEEPSDLMCAFRYVQMESNWAVLSVCNCRHTGKWCGTIKAVGNTEHTRQTWIHMQTPLSPLAGCGPVGEGTSGKVLNWTVRSLNHLHHHTLKLYLSQWKCPLQTYWIRIQVL